VKLGLFRKAKWLVANGMPPTYVAERLGISRTTELYWRQLMDHDGAVKALRRRVLQLPERYREQIATAIQDARQRAA
jgi:hypothetical protein